MAVFALRIVKSTSYMGAVREFGNTYHFSTQTGEPFPDEELANYIAAAERAVTSSEVEFLRWQTWGPTDGAPFDNIMREDGTFDFFGSGVSSTGLYREVCAVVAWPLSRSPATNRKRWLRKFLRMPGFSSDMGGGVVSGVNPLSSSQLAALEQYGDTVRSPQPLGLEDSLCNVQGDEPVGPTEVRNFLTTRDIGR